jgi:alkaline phosphatase
MKYVDGFVLVVPKSKRKEYKKMASEGAKMWKSYGALEYFECVGDDMNPKMGDAKVLTFPKMAKARKGEEVWFSFIIYKSKSHRDAVNKKMMKGMEEWEKKHGKMKMPFDIKRMAYGGFKVEVTK